MKISINQLGREPLVHFLLIGAALFVFYGLTRDVASEAPNRIVVSSAQVEQLHANFKRTWMRPPTEDERSALVENYVREEVFYREALAMGLDQNDSQVRRRMRMKLEFILEDLASQDVTDDALAAFLEKHPDKFRSEAQLSFQHVFLNPEKRKDMAFDYSLATQSEIARSFGERFAEDAIKLEQGDWTGPVYSAYGGHLLKVSERIEERQPELADIRALVEREYLVQRRKEQKDLTYQKLREAYEVTVETLPSAPLASAQAAMGEVLSTAQTGEAQAAEVQR
jgi:ADP-ribosylglycohydrolase